jgi:hypothetical protein
VLDLSFVITIKATGHARYLYRHAASAQAAVMCTCS